MNQEPKTQETETPYTAAADEAVQTQTTPAEATSDPKPSSSSDGKGFKNFVRKHWKWLVPLVAVFVIALIGLLVFALLPKSTIPPASELKPVYGLGNPTKFASSQALVDQSTSGLDGQVRTAATNTSNGGLDKDGNLLYSLLIYKLADREFSNLPVSGTGIAYTGDAAQSEINYTKLVQFFTSNNFRQDVSPASTANYSPTVVVPLLSYTIYSSDDMSCVIWRADISQVTAGTQLTSIGCADRESYVKAADAITPFYEAYKTSPGSRSDNIIFGTPVVTDVANGYKKATVFQEDGSESFTGLYYQTPSNKDWKWFGSTRTQTGEYVSCTSFNTAELKTVFRGVACYNDTAKKNSTVQ